MARQRERESRDSQELQTQQSDVSFSIDRSLESLGIAPVNYWEYALMNYDYDYDYDSDYDYDYDYDWTIENMLSSFP